MPRNLFRAGEWSSSVPSSSPEFTWWSRNHIPRAHLLICVILPFHHAGHASFQFLVHLQGLPEQNWKVRKACLNEALPPFWLWASKNWVWQLSSLWFSNHTVCLCYKILLLTKPSLPSILWAFLAPPLSHVHAAKQIHHLLWDMRAFEMCYFSQRCWNRHRIYRSRTRESSEANSIISCLER